MVVSLLSPEGISRSGLGTTEDEDLSVGVTGLSGGVWSAMRGKPRGYRSFDHIYMEGG